MNMRMFIGVQHEPRSSDCYPYNSNTLHFRIRTGKDNFDEVNLILTDPYDKAFNTNTEQWEPIIQEIAMNNECSTDTLDYWFAEAVVPRKRALYAFELKKGEERYIYTRKPVREITPQTRYEEIAEDSFYKFPYILIEDIFSAPPWAKDMVWYQIFPDRFAKSQHPALLKDSLPLSDWDEDVQPNDTQLYGGDLAGIIEKLDYIQSLGVTGIYLTPIFKAPKCHKYATTDYFEIDPAFGNEAIFDELVNEVHKKGMKIMLDIVFNHCGDTHPYFIDAHQKGKHSEYYDCFHFNDDGSYECYYNLWHMPKWNTSNGIVRQHLLKATEKWAKKGVDGFRLDVADCVSHDFWRAFRKVVKSINPDILIVGEVWETAIPWLLGDQWDSVKHYPLASPIHEYVAGNIDGKKMAELISLSLVYYPKNVTESMFTLLSSHDISRIMTYARKSKELTKQAYTLLMTIAGSPCIFYGDEIGLNGRGGDLARQCMKWEETEKHNDMREFLTKLISIRKNNPATRSVDISWIRAEKDSLIYEKHAQGNKVIVLLNCLNKENTVELPEIMKNKEVSELLGNKTTLLHQTLLMEPHGIRLFELSSLDNRPH